MSWIKLHRQLLDSEVFSNEKQLKIWIWLLLKARFDDGFVSIRVGAGQQTIAIKKGQLLFGRFSAEEQLFIDGSTIYKIIKKFEQIGMIITESNSHYTLITIVKYGEYNDSDLKGNNQITSNEQASNNRVTTEEQQSNNRVTTEEHKEELKESKEVKELKEKEIFEILKFELLNSQIWIDDICRNNSLSNESVKKHLIDFCKKLQDEEDFYKSLQEAKKYFVRWMKIQITKKHTPQKYGPAETPKRTSHVFGLNKSLKE